MMTRAFRSAGSITRQYVYTADDERLAVITPSRELWTLRGTDAQVLRDVEYVSTGWNWLEDYVRGSGLLASESPTGTRHYHLDHLGSPKLVTNSAKQVLARHVYAPYGEELTPPLQDELRMKFTGHERDRMDVSDPAGDLDYMHARYYSGNMGRFLSMDPMDSASLSNPQSWNKYAYVRNNPLKFLDPTGEVEVHFTFNAFIPLGSVTVPFAGIFEGDGAGFSPDRTSVRVQQQFTIETDPAVSADPLVRVSEPIIGLTRELNAQGETIAAGQASGEGVTVGAQRLSDGTVLLNVRGHASNPLIWGAPGIDYSYRLAVTPDGKVICLTCSHDRFPAYDGYIAVGSGQRKPLFQHGPPGGWFAAAGLFPMSPNRSFSGLLYDFGGDVYLDGVHVPK